MRLYEMAVVGGRPTATVYDNAAATDPGDVRQMPLHERLGEQGAPDVAWGSNSLASGYLAYMLLRDALGDPVQAIQMHDAFCRLVVSRVPLGEAWQISDSAVRGIVDAFSVTGLVDALGSPSP